MFDNFKYNSETGQVFKNTKEIKTLHHSGYYVIYYNNKNYIVHRLAWYLYYGVWPKNQLDHIDGNRLNNKINNLREVSMRQNMQNTNKHRIGKLVGCSLRKYGIWQAQIKIKGKSIHLGNFKTELEAHNAYLNAARRVS